MSASSDNVLAGVSPGQMRVLLNVLHDNRWRDRAFVEARYRERARNFEATLAFLTALGWVRSEGGELRPDSEKMSRASAGEAEPTALLHALLDTVGAHRRVFARYLARFDCSDGAVSCSVRGEQSLADGPARDFLMELGAVRFEPAARAYVLERPFIGAYLWALAESGPESGAELIAGIEDRQRLGLDAELAIITFERERLGSAWANQIRHVAGERPASPYDIRSVTVTDGSMTPRYIEVKAVSPADFEFHWSAPEIEIARLLGRDFYLYLLPVRGANDFDLARLQIIANPFAEVFSQPAAWERRPTNFVCRPARNKIS
jgi:hypothetical protein